MRRNRNKKHSKNRTRRSDGGGILFLLIIVAVYYFWFGSSSENNIDNKTYDEKILLLNNTENNLKSVLGFVKDQKNQLIESEIILERLKKEQSSLKPIVEADRKLIDSIFELQEKRTQERIWFERGLSFLLGILASLIAAFIWHRFRRSNNETG